MKKSLSKSPPKFSSSRLLLKKHYLKESILARSDSMKILREFEALERITKTKEKNVFFIK